MIQKMVKLGIVGVGAISCDYVDILCSGQAPAIELTALCSRNAARMREVVASNPLLRQTAIFTDYEKLLASGEVDAVLICTPHGLHPIIARRALESGVHAMVEKPVGTELEDAATVLGALAQRTDLVCGVMYNKRMADAYRHTHKLMRENAIGTLIRVTWISTGWYRPNAYYASAPWRGTWAEEGGGLLMTQASHHLDMLHWLCGMPVSVLARCNTVNRSIEVENEAELLLAFAQGAKGQFISSAHECPGVNRLELCGTLGRITVTDDQKVELLTLKEDERSFTKSCTQPFGSASFSITQTDFDTPNNKRQQAAMLRNFSEAIAGRSEIACPYREGLQSLAITKAAYESWRTGQTVEIKPL